MTRTVNQIPKANLLQRYHPTDSLHKRLWYVYLSLSTCILHNKWQWKSKNELKDREVFVVKLLKMKVLWLNNWLNEKYKRTNDHENRFIVQFATFLVMFIHFYYSSLSSWPEDHMYTLWNTFGKITKERNQQAKQEMGM